MLSTDPQAGIEIEIEIEIEPTRPTSKTELN